MKLVSSPKWAVDSTPAACTALSHASAHTSSREQEVRISCDALSHMAKREHQVPFLTEEAVAASRLMCGAWQVSRADFVSVLIFVLKTSYAHRLEVQRLDCPANEACVATAL